MKTPLLAAVLAVAACSKSPPPAPPPPPVRSALPQVALSSPKDAGRVMEPEGVTGEEALALPHDHRDGIDHLARANELKEEGDLEGALSEARRAVFDTPEDEDAMRTCAEVAVATGHGALAIAAFERLAELRPDDPLPLVSEARLLIREHVDERAIQVARKAQERDDGDAESFHVEGRAYLEKGQLPEAIRAFEKALEIDPAHGHALNNLGFALLRANQNERAADILGQAAELLPNVAYVQNNLGVALERLGYKEEAKLAYARATSLSPKYVKARLNSARVATAREPVPSDLE